MQHEGHIFVDSEPGKGTKFRILFPFEAQEPAVEHIPSLGKESRGNGEQILFVDDEVSLGVFFQRMVDKLGYNVSIANSGIEALAILEQGLKPDLIVTDVVMPGMNGKELADRIMLKAPQQKLLFMSGFTDDIIELFGVQNSKFSFIQKPFSAAEIGVKIKEMLSEAQTPETDKIKVLMLDDEDDLRALFKRRFLKCGHHFVGVSDLEGALQALSEDDYDVLLLDENLVVITGAEALQSIRIAGYDLPAIAISGALNPDHEGALKDLGVERYMQKSFEIVPMIVAAEEVAKRHKQ